MMGACQWWDPQKICTEIILILIRAMQDEMTLENKPPNE